MEQKIQNENNQEIKVETDSTVVHENNNAVKQPNFVMAFLMSFLVMLGGAALWGVIYYLGYFTAWVAFGTSLLAAIVFLKFAQKIDWKVYVWTIVITILLNFISLFISLGLFISTTYELTFADGISTVFELTGNSEFMSALTSDIIYTVLFSLLGAISTIFYFKKKKKTEAMIQEAKKNRENQNASIPSTTTNDSEKIDTDNVDESKDLTENTEKPFFDNVIQELSVAVSEYKSNHDKTVFNAKIAEIKNSVHAKYSPAEIAELKTYALTKTSEKEISTETLVACQLISSQF